MILNTDYLKMLLLVSAQQQTLYTDEADASLFTTDTATQCAFNIIPSDLDTESSKDIHSQSNNNTGIHFYSKHKYRDTFGDAHIQYHDFDNGDAFVHEDKYTALLQQELQNPYWCLHDPITTQSYQISSDMDIETMPHTMYFDGNAGTVTKINHIPYQTIQYNDKGMFSAQLMDDTPIQVFIDNGATPSNFPTKYLQETSYITQIFHNKKHYTHPYRGWYNQIAFLDRTPIEIVQSNNSN